MDRRSLNALTVGIKGSDAQHLSALAQSRRFELAAAVNRLQTLKTVSVA